MFRLLPRCSCSELCCCKHRRGGHCDRATLTLRKAPGRGVEPDQVEFLFFLRTLHSDLYSGCTSLHPASGVEGSSQTEPPVFHLTAEWPWSGTQKPEDAGTVVWEVCASCWVSGAVSLRSPRPPRSTLPHTRPPLRPPQGWAGCGLWRGSTWLLPASSFRVRSIR